MTTQSHRWMALLLGLVALVSLGVMSARSADDGGWQASYWNNIDMEGAPVLTRNERMLDYNWGEASPGAQVNADNFSARWTKTVNLQAGTYRFILSSDDGSRVMVNGQTILDQWADHSLRTISAETFIPAGSTQITVEYFDSGYAAIASLRYSLIDAGGEAPQSQPQPAEDTPSPSSAPAATATSCNNARWQASYYNNRFLSDAPVFTSTATSINFDWANGSPSSQVNVDNFSARWTANINLPAGSYLIVLSGDDGLRLAIDGTMRIDNWIEQPLSTRTFNLDHPGGPLNFRVEHFEAGGAALVSLSCTRLGDYVGAPREPLASPPLPTPIPEQPPAPPPAQQPVVPITSAGVCQISRVYYLNLRSEPSLRSGIVMKLRYGEVTDLTGERQGKWVQVQQRDTLNKGWINRYYCGNAELPADDPSAVAVAPAAPAPTAPGCCCTCLQCHFGHSQWSDGARWPWRQPSVV